jgi:hypothetical protein
MTKTLLPQIGGRVFLFFVSILLYLSLCPDLPAPGRVRRQGIIPLFHYSIGFELSSKGVQTDPKKPVGLGFVPVCEFVRPDNMGFFNLCKGFNIP